jgi:hypothetical protein
MFSDVVHLIGIKSKENALEFGFGSGIRSLLPLGSIFFISSRIFIACTSIVLLLLFQIHKKYYLQDFLLFQYGQERGFTNEFTLLKLITPINIQTILS